MAKDKKIPRWVKPAESPLPLPANPNPPRFLSELFSVIVFPVMVFEPKPASPNKTLLRNSVWGAQPLRFPEIALTVPIGFAPR